jgi:hypothetical protein
MSITVNESFKFDPRQPRDSDGRWSSTPGGGEIGDVLAVARTSADLDDLDANVVRSLDERIGGPVGDTHEMRVTGGFVDRMNKLTSTKMVRDPYVFTTIELHDRATGDKVGEATVDFVDGEDGRYGVIDTVGVDETGSGLGARFIEQIENRLRAFGADRVELSQAVDVGGYAWARLGYDFRDQRERSLIARDLNRVAHEYESSGDPERLTQADIARDVVSRINDGEAVSAREISEIGRPTQPRKTDTWLGRDVLLNSGWIGVKPLSETVTAAVAFKFDPRQPRDPNTGKWTDTITGKLPDLPSAPSGNVTPTPSAKSPGKKVVPAVIYKKHADGAVVAESATGDRRVRWDAGKKKFAVDKRTSAGEWKETQALTKTAAYAEMKKPVRWVEPGQGGQDGQTATKLDTSTSSETPETPSPVVEPAEKTPPISPPASTASTPTPLSDIEQGTLTSLINGIKDMRELDWYDLKEITDMKARLEKGAAPPFWEMKQHAQRIEKIKESTQTTRAMAEDMLRLLAKRDGAPWGKLPEADDSRWMNTKDPSVVVVEPAKITPEQRQKIRDEYVMKDTKTLANNASLRSGSPTPAAKAWRGRVRKLVRSQMTLNDTKVYRGAALSPDKIMQLRPGAVVSDVGSMSTDSDESSARGYTTDRLGMTHGALPVLFEIRVPKNTPLADVAYHEYVLDFDTSIKIVSSELDDGQVHVIAEVIK